MRDNRKIIIFIFLVAFTVRAVAAIAYLNLDSHSLTMRRPFLAVTKNYSRDIWQVLGDREKYNSTARNILSDGPNSQSLIPAQIIAAPLYSIYLAFCYALFGFNILAFFIPQIALASLIAVLFFYLGQEITSRKFCILASLFYALNPHFVLLSIQLYAETLYFFLILLLFFVCQKFIARPLKRYAAGIGILMALSCLCRFVFFGFVPIMLIWLGLVLWPTRPKMLSRIGVTLLLFVLVSGPWILANKGSWQKVFSNLNTAPEKFSVNPIMKQNDPKTRPRTNYSKGIIGFTEQLHREPEATIGVWRKRLRDLLFSCCPRNVSFRHIVISGVVFLVIYPCGYLGLGLAARSGNKVAWLILSFVAFTIIFHTLTWIDGELRYRLPVELFLTLFAAYGWHQLRIFFLEA